LSAGKLYVIDLAGSERNDDSKQHSKQRMDETKAMSAATPRCRTATRSRCLAARSARGAMSSATLFVVRHPAMSRMRDDARSRGSVTLGGPKR
jgi:hypothetical protein